MNPTTHRRVIATNYGGPRDRIRNAIEQAVPELRVEGGSALYGQIVASPGLSTKLAEYNRAVDEALDALADTAIDRLQGLLAQLSGIRTQAAAAEQRRVENAPRVSHLRRGVVA
jgi:hypothetical protein